MRLIRNHVKEGGMVGQRHRYATDAVLEEEKLVHAPRSAVSRLRTHCAAYLLSHWPIFHGQQAGKVFRGYLGKREFD